MYRPTSSYCMTYYTSTYIEYNYYYRYDNKDLKLRQSKERNYRNQQSKLKNGDRIPKPKIVFRIFL